MGRRLDERHVPVYDERQISNRDKLEPGMGRRLDEKQKRASCCPRHKDK
jgi:hypothetical protein